MALLLLGCLALLLLGRLLVLLLLLRRGLALLCGLLAWCPLLLLLWGCTHVQWGTRRGLPSELLLLPLLPLLVTPTPSLTSTVPARGATTLTLLLGLALHGLMHGATTTHRSQSGSCGCGGSWVSLNCVPPATPSATAATTTTPSRLSTILSLRLVHAVNVNEELWLSNNCDGSCYNEVDVPHSDVPLAAAMYELPQRAGAQMHFLAHNSKRTQPENCGAGTPTLNTQIGAWNKFPP